VSNGLPTKAKVGIPGKYVDISPATYFIAKRMEDAGRLRPGTALMLAATLPNKAPSPKRGKKK
jgi:hypothetical protein